MTFPLILTLFVCFFNHVLSVHVIDPKHGRSCHKLNVVLFFANSENSCGISKESAAVKCLGLIELARVKHSISAPHHNGFVKRLEGIVERSDSDCTLLLNEGLSSLTHFCQNALGMKTAIVSVSAQEITKDISEGQEPPEEIGQRQLPSLENLFRFDVIPKKTNKNTILPFKTKSMPIKDVITSPEHTEVFNIRVKRDAEEGEKPGEIINIPLGEGDKKNPWDVLNFMGQIKYSFFGKLFEDKAKSKLAEEENHIPGGISITNEDPGLFETVKSTLTSLQEAPGEEFLMVVFGGHLAELNSKDSPLAQSVKHVIESTDQENTLVVLTGTCGNKPKEVTIREGAGHNEANVPIFAKGPKSEKLQECQELSDIPLTVKNILAESSPSFGEAIAKAREKRSLFSGVPVNRKMYYYNSAPTRGDDKFYSLIFYFSACILFIL